MSNYLALSEEDQAALRMHRLRALEADHYRHALELEEANDYTTREQLTVEMADVQRRIDVHRAVLHLDDAPLRTTTDA